MTQIDATSEELSRTECVAERADIYRMSLALLRLHEWGEKEAPTPHDALSLAHFLAEG